jgi:proline iminopeptidase
MEQIDILRNALHLEKIHLLGHSWGSMLGLDYVLEGREGVSSLILASPVVSVRRWAQDTDSLMRTLPDSIVSIILEHESAGTTDSPEYQDAMSAYFAEFLIRQTPMPAEMDSAMATFNAELYGYMWGPAEWRATGTLRDFEREDRLGELRIPVLYTVGEYDEALPRTVAHYRRLTPGAELEVIEGAAHMTMNDQPERYVEVLQRFLRGVEGS